MENKWDEIQELLLHMLKKALKQDMLDAADCVARILERFMHTRKMGMEL